MPIKNKRPTYLLAGVCLLVAACGGGSGGDDSSEPQVLAALPDTDAILFGFESASISEAGRSLSIPVVRTGTGSGPASVDYASSDIDALAGEDYQAVSGRLSWAAGETGTKYIDFVVYSDAIEEPVESLELELSGLSGSDALAADPVLIVSLQNSACSGILGGTIEGTTVLGEPCYQMTNSVEVLPDGALVLNPGTAILADAGTFLQIGQGASISSVGTAQKPVMLRGVESLPAYWQGVLLTDSDSVENGIEHTIIRDADTAINANEFSQLSTFRFNQLTGNNSAATLSASSVNVLDDSSDFTGNTSDVVFVTGDIINDNVFWSNIDVPYVTRGTLIINGRLEIAPGTELLFGAEDYLLVSSYGVLRAIGTSNQPIRFSGLEELPGFWDGLHFLGTLNGDNELDYVEVSYGGGNLAYPGNIALYAGQATLTVKNSTISFSANHGIWSYNDSVVIVTENLVFNGNAAQDQQVD